MNKIKYLKFLVNIKNNLERGIEMARKFDQAVQKRMQDVGEKLVADLEKKFPKNEIGYLLIEYGKMYLEACNALRDECEISLSKSDFDEFMNDFLSKDSRIFVREPLKLPEENENLEYCKKYVYWNNYGELYMEYIDTYLAKFMKNEIIPKMNESKFGYYYFELLRKDRYVDGTLFMIHHFGNEIARLKYPLVHKMMLIANRYGAKLSSVPEYKIYSRSEETDVIYILIEKEA